MDLDDQLSLGPLFLTDRKCKTCGEVKNLVDGFYKKRSGFNPSSYSYECKDCTIERILKNKKSSNFWEYPDW